MGLGIITIEKGVSVNWGDVISLACSLCFAFHILAIEHFANRIDPLISTIFQLLFCAVSFGVFVLLFEAIDLSQLFKLKYQIIYMALFVTVLPYAIQNVALQNISSTSTALIMSSQAIIGSVFAVLYLGESLTSKLVIGGSIMIFAIITQQTKWRFLRPNKA